MFVEVIALNAADVQAIAAAGGNRVELVSEMAADGLSPSRETIEAVLAVATIPVRAMVRFHNDSFVYSKAEVAQMCAWIEQFATSDLDGFVIGGLTPTGEIDTYLLAEVRKVIGPKKLTFHRAFDRLTHAQQLAALPQLVAAGVDTILTSGGLEQPIGANLAHLQALALAAPSIQILLGGGVDQNVVAGLAAYPHLQAVHVGSATRQERDFTQPVLASAIAQLQQGTSGVLMSSQENFVLRPALRAEAPAILAYIRKLAVHEGASDDVVASEASLMTALFDQGAATAYFAIYQGACVGLAVCSQTFSTYRGQATLFLEDLYLDEHVRGLGLGKAVFSALHTLAQSRGYGRIEWTCLADNESAMAFYDRLGAKRCTDKLLYRLEY